jgi:hypothetical protein
MNAAITKNEPYIHACVFAETPKVGRNEGRKADFVPDSSASDSESGPGIN